MALKKIFFLIITVAIIACSSKSKVQSVPNCFVKYDSLFKLIDTTNLEIIRGTDSATIEVLDKASKDGYRGIMRFDDKDNLRFYAFLYNDHNDASFILTYDSVANRTRRSHGEVVQWTFYIPKDSTIKFTFYLCAIDRNYGDITIKSGKFIKEGITLYESGFTKIICANISINKADLDSTKKIYLTGNWQDKCSKEQQLFVDSTIAL
ncbi:hypothetical protein [Flavisolibacter ginsenosidimutans]|uniref:Uncharacterized protein n=1 Tax=Flavisolibacter ginsenosidimutans TaxID=661481 RepID=A0A5B8UMH3_9BACT|nr:hypothetical protein [Flavisolibacter ginsenosidimutans]QEC57877.1 hypothetical protein FSB75_18865 [Flavisolibacter ginsenosidimutans]